MLIKGNCSKCVLQVINMIYETQLIFYLRIIFLISSICLSTAWPDALLIVIPLLLLMFETTRQSQPGYKHLLQSDYTSTTAVFGFKDKIT